jgi:hypothetical protein
MRMAQKGTPTVRCTITAVGTLVNCWVQQEILRDFGFGKSSAWILAHARMKPMTAGGQLVAGRPYVETFKFSGRGSFDRN